MQVVIDIETDDLNATKIWCIVCREVKSGEVHVFRNLHDSSSVDFHKWHSFATGVGCWIAHNGLGFDLPTLVRFNLLTPASYLRCIDTLVVSRLSDYSIDGGNSLDAWGQRLGEQKTYFKDFSQLTQEMVDYCVQDTLVTLKLYRRFLPMIKSEQWKKALRIEHDMAIICHDMNKNGFYFDYDSALKIYQDITAEKETIEAEFQELFPPKLEPVKELKYSITKAGQENHHVRKAKSEYASWQVKDGKLVCYDYVAFDPASPRDRIDRMWEAGWKPVERTKGHNTFLKEREKDPDRAAKFARYGWTMSEENVATLPADAPEGARKLAKWVTLQGRLLIIRQWLEAYKEDTGRIHGQFLHIGSWTGRMSHNAPNSANIFSPFHGEPRTAVEEVKAKYDKIARACWSVPGGRFLVGTDAEGIQLRILAHTLDNQDYATAIAEGKKEDETDIHNVNKRALGSVCRSRDVAKTFVYGFLLGAGTGKVAQILSCSNPEASEAVDRFMKNTGGLYELKKERIPLMARKGGFTGLDGRFVKCTSEHLMLAGILQNGEACVMKYANVMWRREAKASGIWFKQVNFVHDEWQVEVKSMEDAEELGRIQREAIVKVGLELGVKCPLAGTTDIGRNWSETH